NVLLLVSTSKPEPLIFNPPVLENAVFITTVPPLALIVPVVSIDRSPLKVRVLLEPALLKLMVLGLNKADPQEIGDPPLVIVTATSAPVAVMPPEPPVTWIWPAPVPTARLMLAVVSSVPPEKVRLLATGMPTPSVA